jgi:hypothetical protein
VLGAETATGMVNEDCSERWEAFREGQSRTLYTLWFIEAVMVIKGCGQRSIIYGQTGSIWKEGEWSRV